MKLGLLPRIIIAIAFYFFLLGNSSWGSWTKLCLSQSLEICFLSLCFFFCQMSQPFIWSSILMPPCKDYLIYWGFPGASVAMTSHCQWRGPGFNSWSCQNWDLVQSNKWVKNFLSLLKKKKRTIPSIFNSVNAVPLGKITMVGTEIYLNQRRTRSHLTASWILPHR